MHEIELHSTGQKSHKRSADSKMTYEMCSLPTKIPQSPEKASISQLAESLNLPLRETPGKVPELWENQQFRTPI